MRSSSNGSAGGLAGRRGHVRLHLLPGRLDGGLAGRRFRLPRGRVRLHPLPGRPGLARRRDRGRRGRVRLHFWSGRSLAGLRVQARPGLPDRRQPPLAAAQRLRNLVAANAFAVARVLVVGAARGGQQLADLPLEPRLPPLHPLVAHGLALAGVGPDLGPVDGQGAEVLEVAAAELAYRPVLGEVARRQHAEGDVLLQLPGDPPRRERARRVGVDEDLDHHQRLVRRVAPAVALVGGVEGGQVQRVDQVADLAGQVVLRDPLAQVFWKQERLVGKVGTEACRHRKRPKLRDGLGNHVRRP